MPRLHQIAKEHEIETEFLLIKPILMGFINKIYVAKQTSMSLVFRISQIWSVTFKRLPAILNICPVATNND